MKKNLLPVVLIAGLIIVGIFLYIQIVLKQIRLLTKISKLELY